MDEIVLALSQKRAELREQWIIVGKAIKLHDSSVDGFFLWLRFSAKSEKYQLLKNRIYMRELWNDFPINNTLITNHPWLNLLVWLKIDALNIYNKYEKRVVNRIYRNTGDI